MNAARRFSRLWLGVAGVTFLLNLVLHLPITDYCDDLAKRFGFVAYDTTTQHAFLWIGVLALAAAWLWPSRDRVALGTATTLLMAAALLAQRLIVVVAIENVHYPQYILLVVLLARALPNLEAAWIAGVGLGAIDEAYQLLELPRGTPPYFDWNDMVLDGLGATMGVVIVLMARRGRQPDGDNVGISSSMRWLASGLALAAALFVARPVWSHFFDATPGGRLFHKVAAPEAVFILALLWWAVSALVARHQRQSLSTSL